MRDPDLRGRSGRAWKIKADPNAKNFRPEWAAAINNYLMHCPYAHSMWSWYALSVVHLRPMEGSPAPRLQFPDASHEFLIAAIDPKMKPDPDLLASGDQIFTYLTSIDLVHQVRNATDAQVSQVIDEMASVMVKGQLSPDEDFRSMWEKAIDYRLGEIAYGSTTSEFLDGFQRSVDGKS